MQFLSPYWLYALILPVLCAIGAGALYRQYSQRWKGFVSDPRLAHRLIQRDSATTWWITTTFILLALSLLIIALAKPVNGKDQVDLPTKGKNIYLAIDLSRSMLVEDITPSRLTKAKTLGIEIIESFPDEKIGIISFAGSAWLEAPLTSDHGVLAENLLSLNENTIPYGGSDSAPLLETVIALQAEKQEQTGTPSEALLVIISDGEFHNEPTQADIIAARQSGYTIYTIGVGTAAGGLVPDARRSDGLYRDRRGNRVTSTLKPQPLEKLALFGGGKAFIDRNYDFIPRLKSAIATLSGESKSVKQLVSYNHLYAYFLIPAMIFLVLASLTQRAWGLLTRSLSVLLIAAAVLPQLTPLQAETISYEEAQRLIAEEQYDAAISQLENLIPDAKGDNARKLQFSKGVAQFRAENYRRAIDSFSESLLSDDPTLQTQAHYNLGNTLYLDGEKQLLRVGEAETITEIIEIRNDTINEWQNALGHYQGSLHLTPDKTIARENYDYVKKKLEELQKEQDELMKFLEQMQQGEEGEGEGEGDGEGGQGDGESKGGFTPEELDELMEKERQGNDKPEDKPGPGEENEDKESPNGDQPDQEESSAGRAPGDLDKEEARRKLEENSDEESGNLRTGRRRYNSPPAKDW